MSGTLKDMVRQGIPPETFGFGRSSERRDPPPPPPKKG